jgi:hypothetical protein
MRFFLLPPIARFRVRIMWVLALEAYVAQRENARAAEGKSASSCQRRRRPIYRRSGTVHNSIRPALGARDV